MRPTRRIWLGAIIALATAQAVGCGSGDAIIRKTVENNWPGSKNLIVRGNNSALPTPRVLAGSLKHWSPSESSQSSDSIETVSATKPEPQGEPAKSSSQEKWKTHLVNREATKSDSSTRQTSATVITGFFGKRMNLGSSGEIWERLRRELSWPFLETRGFGSPLEITNLGMLAERRQAFAQYIQTNSPPSK